ncbi:triose-phosphate isomerase [Candidatus Micrarchaeota archaeon]|nr:triose-phosphate isomerase [Candidatus Micrarchaeota archaeon]MBU1165576.1 triose-phosphate isomerase [Candidatus Micrarchaeota archaeon]MBU1887387.1 triose-phosphate isomerase [Candidatus Micrarchaeota archaeon]
MIILNLKTYQESIDKTLFFADIISEVVEKSGVRVILCPPLLHLKSTSDRYSEVFAQHTDPQKPGAHTGSIPAELIKACGAKGSLVNHSEKRIEYGMIKEIVGHLHSNSLESLVCAATTQEAVEIAALRPTFIAVEPPDLIGSGVSVSKANPDIVINSVKAIKEAEHSVKVLCGAGVSNKEDVKKAIELGAEGVLLASAFVRATDPKEFLEDLVSIF